MSYRELKSANGSLRKEWRNEAGYLHREDGPAQIIYFHDGSISREEFWISGNLHQKFLGIDKVGFWSLWERLNEVGRNNPSILKYLVKYS